MKGMGHHMDAPLTCHLSVRWGGSDVRPQASVETGEENIVSVQV